MLCLHGMLFTARIAACWLNKHNRIARNHSPEGHSWFVTTCLIVNSIIIIPPSRQQHLKDNSSNSHNNNSSQRKVKGSRLHSSPSHLLAKSLTFHLPHALLAGQQKNLIKGLTYLIALLYQTQASSRALKQDHRQRCVINATRPLMDLQQVRLAMIIISITFSALIVTEHYHLVYLVSLYFILFRLGIYVYWFYFIRYVARGWAGWISV